MILGEAGAWAAAQAAALDARAASNRFEFTIFSFQVCAFLSKSSGVWIRNKMTSDENF